MRWPDVGLTVTAVKNITFAFKSVTNVHFYETGFIYSVNETFPRVRFSRVAACQTLFGSGQLSVFAATARITTTPRATTSPAFQK